MAYATPADYANPHPMAQPGPRQAAGLGYVSSGIGKDICQRMDLLASRRIGWEKEWRDLADFCLPIASRQMATVGLGGGASFDRLIEGPATREAARRRYDSTAMVAIDRLAAGMESLVTPQSEKWHGLNRDDPLSPEGTEEEKKWFERVRDKLFAVRYDARAGFVTANQKAIRSAITFGLGVVFPEEAFGEYDSDPHQMAVLYKYIPLSQSYPDLNVQGEPDTFYRRFTLTARQAYQKFGEKLSPKLRAAYDDPKKCDTPYTFIHAVEPRRERGSSALSGTMRAAPYASYYVEQDGAHLIGEGGFKEFPYSVYYWLPADESAYAESPTMLALDDIRGVNVMRKTFMRGTQQWADPPLAVAHDGVMNRPNLNPRSINYGAIDGNGRLKIQPILTAQNPSIFGEVIEKERQGIRELLYNNLFQILIQNPQMTATEAMLRANEKGELLGPAGNKIQSALSRVIDREFGILERKGAFYPGSALEIPDSLQGHKFSPKFTSPLDRMRQAKEGAGILTAYQAAGQIAAAKGDPSVFDNFDDDKAIKLVAEVNGAPMSIMRTEDEVQQAREQRAQMMQQKQQMEMAQQAAGAAKDGAKAAVDGTQATGNAAALQSLLGAAMGPGASGSGTAPLPLPQLAPSPVPA